MTISQKNKLWIIGCGDIGRRVACLYQNQVTQTSATVMSMESQQLCLDHHINAAIVDLDNDPINFHLDCHGTSLFYFTPPSKQGVFDLRIKRLLQHIKQPPKRIVLISTTGVYGDCKGQWVDETQPVKPLADRAKRRLDAENTLIKWCEENNCEWIILRVPGIYALDRLPLARLRKQLPLVAIEDSPITNRIHADDLAQICKLAMEISPSSEIYNVVDDHPTTMTEYFNAVADYSELPHPPQISLKEAHKVLSKGMLSYLQESRKISNKKIKDKLHVKLLFPSLTDTFKSDKKT